MLRKPRAIVRRSTRLSLDMALVAEARALGLNIARIAEDSIGRAVSEEKSRKWKIENREALESWNAYVEEHGLPLAKYRQF